MTAAQATVFVPASIGNVGPGFDVLGLAVEGLGDRITVELVEGRDEIALISGRDADSIPREPALNCATIAARAILRRLGDSHFTRISIERALPACGGLGASAAASVGGALAAVYASGNTAGTELILRAALEGESAVAGRHLDNIAPSLLGGLCLVRSTEPPHVLSVPIRGDWWLTVVTPKHKLATKMARSVLPKTVTQSEMVQQMANTAALMLAFSTGDHALLSRSLIDRYAEPRRAPLIPRFHEAKEAALSAGALGCSISGAGPTVFAVSTTERIARQCADAMTAAFGTALQATAHVGRPAAKGAHRI